MDNNQLSWWDNDETPVMQSTNKLSVAKLDFIEGQEVEWQELFEGFSSIKVITYSSSLSFISKVIELFDDAEIIFGCQQVMTYDLCEIMAFQLALVENIRKSKSKDKLISRIKDKTLRMYAARKQLSHEKIYLLSAADGRKRVVMGSANMSNRAFLGGQRENIGYIDGDAGYDWYLSVYEEYIEECTDDITEKAILVSDDGENIGELPVSKSVNSNTVLAIVPNTEVSEEIEFALKINGSVARLKTLMPKVDKKSNRFMISLQTISTLKRNFKKKNEEERNVRQEFPKLHIDLEKKNVMLNGEELNLNPTADEIRNDVSLFIQYMNGYSEFNGEWEYMQNRYYEFANWFFCSPFMAVMRYTARLYNVDKSSYPVFGIIYGQSKAGKTTFLSTLLRMMVGQSPNIAGKEFTRTQGDALRFETEGVPIIVEDIMKTRFDTHAPELIKNDDFGYADNLMNFPAIVFSANNDMDSIKPEYTRRAVCINVSAGLLNEKQRAMNTQVSRIRQKLGTAFYREYLRRMIEIVPSLIEMLKEEGDDLEIPDILNYSSKVIYDIFTENFDDVMPSYVCELNYNDYFSSGVIAKQMRDKIRTAWKNNRSCFTINKKLNELIYNTGNIYEPKKIQNELPEILEAKISRDLIIMRLDTAKKFFGIDFKISIFDRLKR